MVAKYLNSMAVIWNKNGSQTNTFFLKIKNLWWTTFFFSKYNKLHIQKILTITLVQTVWQISRWVSALPILQTQCFLWRQKACLSSLIGTESNAVFYSEKIFLSHGKCKSNLKMCKSKHKNVLVNDLTISIRSSPIQHITAIDDIKPTTTKTNSSFIIVGWGWKLIF